MEFSIDIHTEITGEVKIEDFSKEYGQYIDEEVITSYDYYRYDQSVTLNAIMKMNVNSITLLDVLLNNHTDDIDSCSFKATQDGYYVVEHIILPTFDWYNNASDEYKSYYKYIYITDGEKLYKEIDGKLEECTVKEIIERNVEGTTIKKCKIDIFFTGFLQQCYINFCKNLFEQLLTTCNRKLLENETFSRDFIWMTLNVIDYLIGFKQYMEAQRIIENFQKCGDFCKSVKSKYKHTCGCS